jgi:phosphonate transport system substrate-binding protein
MRLSSRALVTGATLCCLAAGVSYGDASPPPAPRAQLRFGVMAEEPSEPGRQLQVFSELLSQLRRRLAPTGIDVPPLVITRDPEDLALRLTRGEVEFVLESPFPTLLLRERTRKVDPALLVVRRGRSRYRSVFITAKGSPLRSLADLRGRTLVLQATRSTSAFALPVAVVRRAGLTVVAPDDPRGDAASVRYALAGGELNQAVWVLHGRGDAAAFSDSDWEALPQAIRDRLRIFHETQPVPRALLSFRSDVAPAVRAASEAVLLKLHEDDAGRAALAAAAQITRFERLTPEVLAELRAAEPLLQLGRAER